MVTTFLSYAFLSSILHFEDHISAWFVDMGNIKTETDYVLKGRIKGRALEVDVFC